MYLSLCGPLQVLNMSKVTSLIHICDVNVIVVPWKRNQFGSDINRQHAKGNNINSGVWLFSSKMYHSNRIGEIRFHSIVYYYRFKDRIFSDLNWIINRILLYHNSSTPL